MKFTFAAIIAALGMADAKRSSVAQKKQNLLRSATPVNKDGSLRKLGNEAFEITADYSIAFYNCIAMKALDNDMFDEDLYQLAYTGQIVAQKSFVLFDVLSTYNSYYQDDSGSNLFMVPLEQWFEAAAELNNDQDEAEQYCDACDKSYDICYPEEDDAEEGGEEEGNQDDGQDGGEEEGGQDDGQDGGEDGGEDRKLQKKKRSKRKLTPAMKAKRDSLSAIMGSRRKLAGKCEIYVDCYECESRGCFADEEEQEQDEENVCDQDNYANGCVFEDGQAQEFVKEAQCVETGKYYVSDDGENVELMAGLMCNEDGSGVEMAIFLDEDCAVYDKSRSFSTDMANTYVYNILSEAKYFIETPFTEPMDCLQCEYVELEEEDENADNNNDGDQEEEEEAEVTEVCQNIMDGALDIATCGGAEAQQDDGNDNNNGDNDVDISWYSYDIDAEAEEDEVCLLLQNMAVEDYSNYHVYEGQSSFGGGGVLFDYSKATTGSNSGGKKAGKIVGIIIAVLVVVVAGVFIGQSFAKKSDSKKQPLVSNKNGAMA